MISIQDRYILGRFLGYFSAGILVFTAIFLAVDFMGSMVRYDVSTTILFKYYFYFIPGIIYQMTPVAALLATLFTLSSLNKTNELVALFSLGNSLARVSAPIMGMVALISVLAFWTGDRILPKMAQQMNFVKYVEIEKKPGLYSTIKSDKIWYRSKNILFNIKTINQDGSKAQGVTLYYFDADWHLRQLLRAAEAIISGNNWELQNGRVTLFSDDSSFPFTRKFKQKVIKMNEEVADIQTASKPSEVQSVAELGKFIKRNKDAGLETVSYEVSYHGKYSFAFAAFVMSLLGIPFSVKQARSGSGVMSVGVCMGLAFGYWLCFSSSMTLGKHGIVPPIIAAWGANVVFLAFSIRSLSRLNK